MQILEGGAFFYERGTPLGLPQHPRMVLALLGEWPLVLTHTRVCDTGGTRDACSGNDKDGFLYPRGWVPGVPRS